MDVSHGSGIWERRRSAIFKNKRMVKIKDKDKGKVKQCKTIIIVEDKELSLASPPAGKQLADVLAGLSPEDVGNVIGHLPCSIVQNWVQSIWGPASDGTLWVAFFPG